MKSIRILSFALSLLATLFSFAQTGTAGPQTVPMTAILTPEFRISDPPEYLITDFHVLLESSLVRNGVRIHNMQAVQKVLRHHRLPRLSQASPAWYSAIGKALQVQTLIQCAVTRFEVIETPYTISETGASGIRRTGFAEGFVRVIATHTGELLSTIPFRLEIDFRKLDRQSVRDWQIDDYCRFMTENIISGIVPELLKIPELVKTSAKL
ncbi:MAG: hypothetical protein IKC94_02625 [Lentisphaeria bacterium]|nr:hypothetical protein [Lentisphaeria bacterium]